MAVALTFGVATAGVAAAVPAQQSDATQPDPAQQVVNSWALTPCGTDPTQPGARPTFSYTLSPGAVQNDCLTVWNYSNVQLNFHVYAADALNNASGAFDLIDEGKKSTDAGSWVKIAQNYVTLPASSSVRLPVTITVPANATPGDHTAGIVASSQTPAKNEKGGQILLNRRVGSRLYIRVSGPVSPALTTENLSADYHPSVNPLDGSLDVTYTVRNNGNVRLGAKQAVTVHDVFGAVAEAHPKELPELLPGNSVTVTQHFSGVAATVRVSTDVALTPFVPRASGVAVPGKIAVSTTSTHAWAIPWSLLAVLLVLGIVIWLARRRRRDDGLPDGAQGADGAPGGYALPDGYSAPVETPAGAAVHAVSWTPPPQGAP